MCGIAGKLLLRDGEPISPSLLERMAASLAHRGPDDEGTWTDGRVGLASRRLAVIDLSPRGHMPMASDDGRLQIVFNGEIYNFQALRRDLEADGSRFRSNSDTEVILHLYAREGPAAVRHLRGMFALALWDAERRRLLLARDRLGKKPLFYYQDQRLLAFASEPKAILQDPSVVAEADWRALDLYLSYGYVPAPWSAFKGMKKLPPGHYLVAEDGGVTVEPYWQLRYTPQRRAREPELTEELLSILEESTRLRMISDVPLGALLSGGIDSSAVVAMMRRVHNGRIRTFSIGFDEAAYDESRHARTVADHLGTEHESLVVRPDAVSLIPRLVWHYNEPFADSSAVPSFAVAALARRSVTVALSGDGGDESFVGYDRYVAAALAGRAEMVPRALRTAAAGAARGLLAGPPKSRRNRLRRLIEPLALDPRRRYQSWMTCFSTAERLALYSPALAAELEPSTAEQFLDKKFAGSDAPTFVESCLHADVQMYLPDDLLVKMDIASMAYSLEVRSPFLDHCLVEFAARLPLDMKLRGMTQKYLLKRAVAPLLPPSIVQRAKAGFGVPLERWFREDLRPFAYDVLLDERARSRGLFKTDVVKSYLDRHVAGDGHYHVQLWALIMLELWFRQFIDRPIPAPPPEAGMLESGVL